MLFYIYQIVYKFVSGMAKVATLLLLLAISARQMTAFNLFCKIFTIYICAYCFATAVASIFQCGTAFASNWNKELDQSQCFYLPPFWYAHAAINISATAVMAILPWWLFAKYVSTYNHPLTLLVRPETHAITGLHISENTPLLLSCPCSLLRECCFLFRYTLLRFETAANTRQRNGTWMRALIRSVHLGSFNG